MGHLDVVTIFVVFFSTVSAQDEPVSVHFVQNGTIYTRVGGPFNVTCEVNRPLAFLLDNDIDIIVRSARGELLLSQGLRRVGNFRNYYQVDFELVPNDGFKIHFFVPSALEIFDGKLICGAKLHLPRGRKVLAEADLDIVIMTPLESFRLKLDDAEPITVNMDDPVELDSGDHALTCIAEGSNPAALVQLYLDGKKVLGAETKSEKMDASLTKFRTVLTASIIIWKANFVHELKCVAQSRIGEDRSVQLPVKIKSNSPKIRCKKSQAFEGQKNLVLSCTIDYNGLDITGFRYSLGGKEYNAEGHDNDEFVQVSKEHLSDTRVKVLLKLTEVKDWHFKNEFYLMVFHRDGCITRESVRLSRVPGNSTILRSSLTTLLMTYGVFVILILVG